MSSTRWEMRVLWSVYARINSRSVHCWYQWNHFWSHFLSFQINMQLFLDFFFTKWPFFLVFFSKWLPVAILDAQFLPKSIGTSLYNRWVATSDRVFPLYVINGCVKNKFDTRIGVTVTLNTSLDVRLRLLRLLRCGGGSCCGCGGGCGGCGGCGAKIPEISPVSRKRLLESQK